MPIAARLAAILATCLVVTACNDRREPIELPAPASGHGVAVDTVVEGLRHPWSLAFLPDGGLLITERGGEVGWWRDGELSFLTGTFPDVLSLSQGGLLEVALAPDFEETRELYLSFAHGTADSNNTALYRVRFVDGALIDGEIIWEAQMNKTGGAHFGGRIAFLPDDTLLLTLGDGFEFREEAQNLSNHFGTIVRLNRDGSAPADNPFAGQEGALADIWSYGHRNVQGIVYDAQTGRVWSHEHGPRGGDELNLIAPGQNYGWPIVTSGLDYSGARITPFTDHEGRFTAPVREWLPYSIAPAGLAIYRGEAFANWDGDLLIAALAGQALHRVVIENGEAVAEEVLLSDLGQRIRDVRVGPDGLVYVLTDAFDGALLRLSPAD